MIIGIEFGFVMAAVVLAFTFPRLGSRWFEAVERPLGRLAERPRLSVAVVGLTALALRVALLPVLPIPEPAVHDEFSHLLAADTFAHGRLTNPTHPMWVHFETFHVLWHPTYYPGFPPGQGLILAFGQAVLGHPFWGVWISLGLMCAALCWMLQAWVPPKWALLGGFLAVIRLATFSYWANSYWGGALAATGGALVYGALPRLKHSLRILDALLLGLGLVILANTRPYEGLVFSLPVGAALLVWMLREDRPHLRASLRRLVLPTGVVLGIAAVLMGYFFWKVTGSPWRMPEELYHETHLVTPFFIGQAPWPIPVYHHQVMRDFYLNFELPAWRQTRTLGGVLQLEYARAVELWTFYFQSLFTLPLLMSMAIVPFGFSWREISPGTRFLLLAAGFGLAGYALEVFSSPHYAAPGTCQVYAFVLTAMSNVRSWKWRQKPVGLAVTRAMPLIAVLLLVLCVAWGPALRPRNPTPSTWCMSGSYNLMEDRAQMLAKLQGEPGLQLVIVRYSPTHNFRLEWVHNHADIDGSKVIWARDMGREKNADLVRYFQGRRIWLVEPDLSPPRLSPYPAE